MSREIKFRAWYKYGKKMLEVVSIHFPRKHVYVRILKPINFVQRMALDEDIELMQYTGLKDCKGQEIFEGDIVRYTDPAQYNLPATTMVVAISWDEETAGFNLGHISHRLTIYDDVEVIGNIYEHRHLIEGESKNDVG